MWASWICLFLLSTRRPTSRSRRSTAPAPSIGLNVYAFTALMFASASPSRSARPASSSTSATTIPHNIGTVSGIVGLAGGMGGFVLPIMFGALMDLTGIRSSAFMLMYGVVWVSLIWMYWTEVRAPELMGGKRPAVQPSP